MVEHSLDESQSIFVVRPKAALTADDFAKLAGIVDPYIQASGGLAGIIIETQSFPGWESLGALASHFRFIRDHHRHVRKVAVVTDSALGQVAEHLASHFVSAEIRRFPSGYMDAAKQWVLGKTIRAKNRVCLWYDGTAEDAAQFYARTFPDSSVGTVLLAPGDHPSGKTGDVLTVEFTVMGIPCIGLNGGPMFKQSEAFSFQVETADQAETDRYWDAIVSNGGEASHCGWCKDKWGVSWQITPTALMKAIVHPDPAVANRAFNAMMSMRKINIAAIDAAVRG